MNLLKNFDHNKHLFLKSYPNNIHQALNLNKSLKKINKIILINKTLLINYLISILKYQINNVVCPVLEGYKTKIIDMPKEISNAFTNMI